MYSAPITRRRKALFVILVDRSGSMDEKVRFAGVETTKAQAVTQTANLLIDEIINRSRRDEGVSNYCDIAVIGYAADRVEPLLGRGESVVSVTELSTMPSKTEKSFVLRKLPDGRTVESVIERKYWFEAAAAGNTPLNKALLSAEHVLKGWCKRHPASFPPIVINITDGEASDADESEIEASAERIKATRTEDGATLLMNIHISSECDADEAVKYPSENEPMPDNRLTHLFCRISSTLPAFYNNAVAELKGGLYPPPYKAICYNSSADELVSLLNIGSASINKIL